MLDSLLTRTPAIASAAALAAFIAFFVITYETPTVAITIAANNAIIYVPTSNL